MVVLEGFGGVDAPVPRHAEVEDQGVAAIGVDQAIFGAAPEARHPGTRQPLAKIERKRMAQIGPPRLDVADAMAEQDSLQPANGGLDFGKLGHGRRYGGAVPSPLEARAA